jgi:glycosyltransferase involved in cell wall biosynthesis
MSRILLVGYPPPPYQRNSKVEAAHYRTWQFVQPLLDDGHTICLCVPHTSERPESVDMPANLVWQPIPFEHLGWPRDLQVAHDRFEPDCVVGVDFYPALYATRLKTTQPMWLDLYGDPLTISQVARFRQGTDQGIGTAIALMRQVLERGDVFSACGMPQKHALAGELAMCGRLNSRTLGYDFIEVIYPGAAPYRITNQLTTRRAVREAHGIDSDAFIVLWAGGYNTWTDVVTLFKGLEIGMERNPRVHFLSVGASTYQAAETQYDHFVHLATHSPYAGRFHFLGWQSWKEMSSFYQASDVGINIDALHYETIYGTRTRLVEMLAYGLPVITTDGCELSSILKVGQAGRSFATSDWAQLAQHIQQLADAPDQLQQMQRAGCQLIESDLSFHATTTKLRSWAKAPFAAPNRVGTKSIPHVKALKYRARTRIRMLLWKLGASGRH